MKNVFYIYDRSISVARARPQQQTRAGRRCCCRSTGQTDGRTDTRTFYDAYNVLCGPHQNETHENVAKLRLYIYNRYELSQSLFTLCSRLYSQLYNWLYNWLYNRLQSVNTVTQFNHHSTLTAVRRFQLLAWNSPEIHPGSTQQHRLFYVSTQNVGYSFTR